MGTSRRQFLKSTTASTVLWSARPAFADRSDSCLALSAPLTHSDWQLKPGIAAGVEGLRHMLDACKACGWNDVYWRAFDAGQSTYASKLLSPASHPTADNYFAPQNDADRRAAGSILAGDDGRAREEILEKLNSIDYGAFDSLAAAIEYGHAIGLRIHAWATINEDDHGWGWQSEFSKTHPEYRWVRRDGRVYRSQLSFAFPEVRAYKLTLMEELLAYDIDGLFVDWIRTGDVRDNPQTDAAGVADSGYEAPNVEAFTKEYGVDPHDVAPDDDRWVRLRAHANGVHA